MKFVPIIILFFTLSFPLFSQDSIVVKSIQKITVNSFQLGIGNNQIKEKNLHPKVHTGFILDFKYSHYRTKQNFTRFQFGFHYSRLKTKLEDLSASINIGLLAQYAYQFEMVKKAKTNYYLGPEFNLSYNLSLYPNWDESHLYWADGINLGVANRLSFAINEKRAIIVGFSIPLFSVIARPELNREYKIDDISFGGIVGSMNSGFETALWHKSFYLFAEVEYRFQLSKRLSEAVFYSFNYYRIKSKTGEPFQTIQHSIGLKIYIK